MKNLIQSTICLLLAFFILPTEGNTQSVGDKYMDGIVFEMDASGKSGMMCKTVDLSTKMGLEDAHRAGANGYGVPDLATLRKMYNNLKAKGLGDFSDELYWSSKVVSAMYRTAINFADGKESNKGVNDQLKVRLVKRFEVTNKNTLAAGEKLNINDRLVSADGSHYLIQQEDGNLCVYTSQNGFKWCSMAHGFKSGRTEMQTDGNLVVYDGGGTSNPKWDSKTHPYRDSRFKDTSLKPIKLVLENDGKLNLYNAANSVVWSNK